jgi:hypothetical protein
MNIKQRRIAFYTLVIVLLLTGCSVGKSADPSIGISGTIMRSDTGATIPNAQITLYAENVSVPDMTSDAKGHFSSPEMKPGTYSIFSITIKDAKSELPCFSPIALVNSKGPLTVMSLPDKDGSTLLNIEGLDVIVNDGKVTKLDIDLYEICGVFRK